MKDKTTTAAVEMNRRHFPAIRVSFKFVLKLEPCPLCLLDVMQIDLKIKQTTDTVGGQYNNASAKPDKLCPLRLYNALYRLGGHGTPGYVFGKQCRSISC